MTNGHGAGLVDFRRKARDGRSTARWSSYDSTRGPVQGTILGRRAILHVRNYLQQRGVHPGSNTLALRLDPFVGKLLLSAQILPGSSIAQGDVGPLLPVDAAQPPPTRRSNQASTLTRVPLVPPGSALSVWNYDFYSTATGTDNRPIGSTDNPVTLLFGDNATLARIEHDLRPHLTCWGTCGSMEYARFEDAGTGRRLWLADRGVKTRASYPCPDHSGAPADYHLRLYGPVYDYRMGFMVVGTTHIDCDAVLKFGWQEQAERFLVRLLSHRYAVTLDAYQVANAWPASGAPGCRDGRWRPPQARSHCMESDGRATYLGVPAWDT